MMKKAQLRKAGKDIRQKGPKRSSLSSSSGARGAKRGTGKPGAKKRKLGQAIVLRGSGAGERMGRNPDGVESGYPWAVVHGYEVTEKGVFKGTKRNRTRLTTTPAGVLGLAREVGSKNFGLVVGWVDRDHTQHKATIPRGRFSNAELLAELASDGLEVIAGRERDVLAYFTLAEPVNRYRIVPRTGWAGSSFVLPNDIIAASIDDEQVLFQPEHYTSSSLAVRSCGSLEQWQQRIAKPVFGNPVLEFALCVAFAGPLLKLVGHESGGFHLYGGTSKGKSTSLQVAASVWGDGGSSEGSKCPYVLRWNSTRNSLEGQAALHNDLPLCLDELSEADAKEFPKSLYLLAGGMGRGRMRSNTSLRTPSVWTVLFLSSGEVPIDLYLASHGHRLSGGQSVRLIDLPADDPENDDGIVVNTHDMNVSPAAFIDNLKRAAGEEFGIAGPEFLRCLLKRDLDSVIVELKETVRHLTGRLGRELALMLAEQNLPTAISPEVNRALKRFALVATAGEFASHVHVLPWPEGTAIHAVNRMVKRYILARGGAESDDNRILEAVKDFISVHRQGRFLDIAQPGTRVQNLAGYTDTERGLYYLTKAGMREASKGHDLRETLKVLASRKFLLRGDGRHLTDKVVIPGLGRTRLYVIDMAILQAKDDERRDEHSSH